MPFQARAKTPSRRANQKKGRPCEVAQVNKINDLVGSLAGLAMVFSGRSARFSFCQFLADGRMSDALSAAAALKGQDFNEVL